MLGLHVVYPLAYTQSYGLLPDSLFTEVQLTLVTFRPTTICQTSHFEMCEANLAIDFGTRMASYACITADEGEDESLTTSLLRMDLAGDELSCIRTNCQFFFYSDLVYSHVHGH
jgi:hypothetical protein